VSEELGKKEALKDLIRALHAGASPDQAKQRFKSILETVGPTEIARVEEELIAEGVAREEIQRLCDVHLAVFRESLEGGQPLAPVGHPIRVLMQEHSALLQLAEELTSLARGLEEAQAAGRVGADWEQIRQIEEHLKGSDSHYLREENVLFPYLEKHGITQPPAIMWMEHDTIRERKKNLYRLIDDARGSMAPHTLAWELKEAAQSLAEFLSSHFYKENNILFPTALKVIDQTEWEEIGRQFDELGYCCVTP
jgi:DUF438 domain-containing protein